jgi:hypothetical protein
MEHPKTWMLVASMLGATAGIYFTTVVMPMYNYLIFMGIFALIGAGIANLALLAAYKVYLWLGQD